MSKVIILDLGSLTHTAIFANYAQKQLQLEGKITQDAFIMSPAYNFFNSMISLLKRVGVSNEDLIIFAGDGRNSWRKIFDKNYKAQRAGFRAGFDINWPEEYQKISRVIQQIDNATDFHVIWESGTFNGLDLINAPEGEKYLNIDEVDLLQDYSLEADDIAAVCCKFFKDNEMVLITKDADWKMLTVYPNVKFFSMNLKYKGGTGVYEPIENGYKILEKKIRLGDVSDNIIVDKENDTERDKEIRKLIIDLIHLPEFVEQPIRKILENLPKKENHFENLPFPNSLANKFQAIYLKDKIVTYNESIERIERKEVRLKNKKLKLKKESTLRKITKEN